MCIAVHMSDGVIMARLVRVAMQVVLLIMCIAIITAWISSYHREDRLIVSRAGRCHQVISHDGLARVFLLYEYPVPLPWIWEHDNEGRPSGRTVIDSKRWRGEGGTVEFFRTVKQEYALGPLQTSHGFADSDPSRKELQKWRLSG